MYLLYGQDKYDDDQEHIAVFTAKEAAESAKKTLENSFEKDPYTYSGYYRGRYMVVSYFGIEYIREWQDDFVGKKELG
jgi:hypothetical protein